MQEPGINIIDPSTIFIVGNSRSGTTMMSRMLGMTPEVFSFRELHFFQRLCSKKNITRLLSKKEAINLLTKLMCTQREGIYTNNPPEKYCNEAENIVNKIPDKILLPYNIHKAYLNYEAKEHRKSIPCEQTPFYVFYIGEILKFYPNAKIINMIRDPRDVLLSQKRKCKRQFYGTTNIPIPLKESFRTWLNYHPVTISKLWNASISAAHKYSNNNQVYFLRFEDLVEDPEHQIHKLCNFIGIPFGKHMIEVPQVGSSNYPDQPDKKGIDKERIGSWKKHGLNLTEIFLCQRITSSLMNKYGYSIKYLRVNYFGLIFYTISLPLKLLLSFVVNLKRMNNIIDTIKRRL